MFPADTETLPRNTHIMLETQWKATEERNRREVDFF